jgi:hypothetical protein
MDKVIMTEILDSDLMSPLNLIISIDKALRPYNLKLETDGLPHDGYEIVKLIEIEQTDQ